MDSALYGFLIVRRLEGVGYDFRARARDMVIGLRECSFFAPIAIALGIAVGFIAPHGGVPPASSASAALVVTFFFVAIPEELFFRGLFQNLLEKRIGYSGSLFVTAVIFGLSAFQQAAALQLALRVAGDHCWNLLWPRMAQSSPTAGLGNYPHAGGCHLVIVVSVNGI
jgi:uncharacterized protein